MKKLYILFVVCIAFTTACTKEPGSKNSDALNCCAEFNATIDDSISKTTVEYDGSKYEVKWVANETPADADNISIKDSEGNVGIFYVDKLNDLTGKSAHFKNLSGSVSAPDFHAIYPADLYNSEKDTYTLPSIQTYVSSSTASEFPMVASSGTSELSFKNICGIIRLTVSNKTGNDIDITGISVSDATKGMSGIFTIDWENEVISGITGTAGVTLKCESGVAVEDNASESFIISIPAGTYDKLTIVIATSDNKSQTFIAKNSVTVVKSTFSDFCVKATELFFDYVYGDANCYLATPGSPVTVSVEPYGVIDDCCTKTAALYAPVPKGAKVLWTDASLADNCSDVSIDKSNISLGSITVTTPSGRYGNAVVAIYDDALCNGRLLWSYHIWVPSQDPTLAIQEYTQTRSGYDVYAMPMNLGAIAYPTTTPISYSLDYGGLNYQWGRKDPIVRLKNDGSNIYVNLNPRSTGSVPATVNKRTSILKETMPLQVMEAINYCTQNPTVRIDYENGAERPCWAYLENNSVNFDFAKNFWGNPTFSHNPLAYRKSVYDPCPDGYKVSPGRMFPHTGSKFTCVTDSESFFSGVLLDYDGEGGKSYYPVSCMTLNNFYAIDYNYPSQRTKGGSVFVWSSGWMPITDASKYRVCVESVYKGETNANANASGSPVSTCQVRCIRDDYSY